MRARSKVIAVTGIGLAIAVGLAGCGQAEKISAKNQVSDAMTGLEGATSATFTMKLDTTAADLTAIAKAQGDDEVDDATAQKVLTQLVGGDVVIAVQAPAGKTFGEASKAQSATAGDAGALLNDPKALAAQLKAGGNASFAVNLSGSSLVEVRTVDGVVYARADVKKIAGLAGQNPAIVDQQLAGLPPAFAPLAQAAKGRWISIDVADAAAAAKDSGLLKALPSPSATPSVDAAKVQRLIDALKAAYQQNATITELEGDNAAHPGTAYRLTAPAKQVALAVQDDVIALVGKSSEADIRKTITGMPDKTVALDVWVEDDALSGARMDLTQFLEKPVPGKKLALDLGVDVDTGAVTAPAGATELDVKALLAQIPAGALAGATGAGAGAGSSASVGAGEISDAQMKQLKAQTGMSEKEIRELMEAGAAR